MSTFIHRIDGPSRGLRVAVKDLIDMAGLPTTAGSRAVASDAKAAAEDAPCLAGTRAAEADGRATIVGKSNLHELAFGVTGINPWFGTAPNPLDSRLVPGGSSSGSATAVGSDEADVAFGSDTGGSVRIPAACCGVVGLKTTRGRVPLGGVFPLAPSMDTVGPMAATVSLVIEGMALLEPGFQAASTPAGRIGRLRPPADIEIDSALDRALAAAGFEVQELDLPGWSAANDAAMVVLGSEAWSQNAELFARRGSELDPTVAERLEGCSAITEAQVNAAWQQARAWDAELAGVFQQVQLLALPTIGCLPPTLENGENLLRVRATAAWNLAGLPAIALPVPVTSSRLPASLQLVGPAGSEELLVATAALVEGAVRA